MQPRAHGQTARSLATLLRYLIMCLAQPLIFSATDLLSLSIPAPRSLSMQAHFAKPPEPAPPPSRRRVPIPAQCKSTAALLPSLSVIAPALSRPQPVLVCPAVTPSPMEGRHVAA